MLPKGWSCSHWMATLPVSVSHDFGSCGIHGHRRIMCTISLGKSEGTILFCSSVEYIWTGNPGVSSPTPKKPTCLQVLLKCSCMFLKMLGSWLCHMMEPTKTRHDFVGQCSDVWAEDNCPCSCITAISSQGEGAKDRQGKGTAAFRTSLLWCETYAKIQNLPGWDVVAVPKAGTGLGLQPHD